MAWLAVLLCACGTGIREAPVPVGPVGTTSTVAQEATPAPSPDPSSSGPTSSPSAARPAVPADETVGSERWTRVLDGLNRTRSRALHQMRPALLGRVYVRGSPVLRRERAVLSAYRVRGVGLLGGRLHTASVRVMARHRHLVVLRAVETLGATTAVLSLGHQVRLPADSPTRRALRLVPTSAGWRIAAARRLAG